MMGLGVARRRIHIVAVASAFVACADDGGAGDAASGSGSGSATSGSGADDATGADATSDATAASGSGSGGAIDCDAAGWQTITMPWSQLAYENEPDGGFSVCVPEPWEVASDASNIIQLVRGTDPATRIVLGGELRLDHADAVARVGQQDSGFCTAADYGAAFASIDGWPAMQQQFTFDEPACGECPDPTPATRYAVSTYAATGIMLVAVTGQTTSPPVPAMVDELLAIGGTLRATGVGTPDASATAQEIVGLEAAHADACPP